MKLHRFFVEDMELPHNFWLQDDALFHQWVRVLRFQVDREIALFNKAGKEKLYSISKIGTDAVHLTHVTDIKGKKPVGKLYLCFSLLKKDKNDWVLQKATELGVTHLMPMLCDRTEKTGFSIERAQKIVIEAAEQCGRVDIPKLREPTPVQSLVEELDGKAKIYVAEQGSHISDIKPQTSQPMAVLIGPEGGWSDEEKHFFQQNDIQHVSLSQFTLRAETAAITAVAILA